MTTNDDDHADESKTVLAEDAVAKVFESDEKQRERKGKAKIVFVSNEHKKESDNEKKKEEESDHEKNRCFAHVPRKIRPALRYPQPDFENPNGASTSSPFWTSDEHKKESDHEKKKEEESDHEKYRFLMERAIRKRCMTSPSNNGGFKIPMLASFSRTTTRREMPSWLDLVMREMNAHRPSLVFEKALFPADVNPNHSRLLMPFNSFIRGDDFLTRAERRILEEEDLIGVGAILVDPRCKKWGVVLKRYSGNRRSWRLYSLTSGWNDVVKANDLKVGDNILLWSFRCGETLCFALYHETE